MRDRRNRKAYTEPTTSEEEFNDSDDDEEGEDEDEEEPVALVNDEEDAYEQPKARTRRIILKLNAEMLQQVSQQTPEANGAEHDGEDEDAVTLALADVVEDLEAEIQDLKEAVKLDDDDDDDDDDEGGPRRLTRRVTRQSSFSKQETAQERPVQGRKGLGRQDRSSDKPNGGHASPPEPTRRSSMSRRLRKMSRKSHEEKKEKDKKKQKVSESEFEDEGDEQEDDLSIASDKNVHSDEEEYSSAPHQRHSRKPLPSRARPKRSRNVSDDESMDDGIELEEELREIGAEIPQRQRQLRPTGRMNYYIPPPPDKDDIFLPAPGSSKKRSATGRGFGGFGGFGGDFSNMGLGNRFRGITGLGTAGGAEDSSDSVC